MIMGRKKINATKSGRFMNPTDRARKEMRKKELKKNKKQRQIVRSAMLKAKDGYQLLEEMAFYDKQEYDINNPSTLNPRVIQEKRRKLLETYDRILNLYKKEEPEFALKLQVAKNEYDIKGAQMKAYYEQVKLAEKVTAKDDIPLPSDPVNYNFNMADIPLPNALPPGLTLPPQYFHAAMNFQQQQRPAKGILKGHHHMAMEGSEFNSMLTNNFAIGGFELPDHDPPGPPPGAPPDLSDEEDGADLTVDESLLFKYQEKAIAEKRIRFAEEELAPQMFDRGGGVFSMLTLPPLPQVIGPPEITPFMPSQALRPHIVHPGPPIPMAHSHSHLMRISPQRYTFNSNATTAAASSTIVSAPPNIRNLHMARVAVPNSAQANNASSGVIEAKPQLKNLIGDATKFVPSSLRVKRQMKDFRGKLVSFGGTSADKGFEFGDEAMLNKNKIANMQLLSSRADYDVQNVASTMTTSLVSKDVAYDDFIKEIDSLI